MAARSARVVVVSFGTLCVLIPFTLIAQAQREAIPLKSWPAPLYWQPTLSERQTAEPRLIVAGNVERRSTSSNATDAQTPAGALLFVAMTPCRLVDTRTGFGFTGDFGPPSLVGGGSRTFPIQSSPNCTIPAIAQAYSFNVTVVPAGATFPGNVNPSGALGFLTIWPTGATQPNASTLNSWLGTVAANAAIAPAGTSGSVDVFASNNTDLIIDINGYYAPQGGITLAQGTGAAPSLSFSNDPGTGIFSSGAGILNIAAGGSSRARVLSNGDLDVTGSFAVGGNRVLSTAGNSNLFVGGGTGQANTSGTNNTFAGASAGLNNTIGSRNSFFGFNAGRNNLGDVFGNGSDNSFFGSSAGVTNTGQQNSFFGSGAGAGSTTGNFNSFFGEAAGLTNTTGGFNTFLGSNAGITADSNNNTGSKNTAIGFSAKVGLDFMNTSLTNATAVGANATVTASNALVLGSINGVNGAAADTKVGIGTTAPSSRLEVIGNNTSSCGGAYITFGTFIGGDCAAALKLSTDAPFSSRFIDAEDTSGTVLQLRGNGDIVTKGFLGVGTFSPDRLLTVNGRAKVASIPPEASVAQVCFNPAGDLLQCGASSYRFKRNVEPFTSGTEIIRQLRPISFEWKDGSGHDIGLGAEDVAKVAPSLTFTDKDGEIVGIKYERLSILVINAVNQQQAQIEDQQKTIQQQRSQIDLLKQLVCLDHPKADICQ